MPSWFQAKIKYQVQDEQGRQKAIAEVYLFDAVSYTDAETRLYNYVAQNMPDFQLTGLTKLRIQEVFFEEEGAVTWYKVKVNYIEFDEKAQKEKKIPYTMLINAENPKEAYEKMIERLGTVQDYQITDINLTPILEVVPYESEIEQKIKDGRLTPISELQNTEEHV
jgi:hypothetical protein